MIIDDADREQELRDEAVRRLKKQRDFRSHLLVYVLVNTLLVVIWVMTDPHGFFWPVFPIAGMGQRREHDRLGRLRPPGDHRGGYPPGDGPPGQGGLAAVEPGAAVGDHLDELRDRRDVQLGHLVSQVASVPSARAPLAMMSAG